MSNTGYGPIWTGCVDRTRRLSEASDHRRDQRQRWRANRTCRRPVTPRERLLE